jgi:prevent-host-death family protein
MGTWAVAKAKARFSALIDIAQEEGAQKITRNGKLVGLVVSPEDWEKRSTISEAAEKPFVSAWDALGGSETAQFDFEIPRTKSKARWVKF